MIRLGGKIGVEARRYCGMHFPKGDLAEIDTVEKIQAITNLYLANYDSGKKNFKKNLLPTE